MLTAIDSCGNGKKIGEFRNSFAMLETIREDSQSESLYLCQGIFPAVAVCHNTRERRHFRHPTTVLLLFQFYSHGCKLQMEYTH